MKPLYCMKPTQNIPLPRIVLLLGINPCPDLLIVDIQATFGMPEESSVDGAFVISARICCQFANEDRRQLNRCSSSRSSQRLEFQPLDHTAPWMLQFRLNEPQSAPKCHRGIASAGIKSTKEGPRKGNWLRTSVSVAKPPCNLTALTLDV